MTGTFVMLRDAGHLVWDDHMQVAIARLAEVNACMDAMHAMS